MRKLDTTTPIAVVVEKKLYCLQCRNLAVGEPQTEEQVIRYGALHMGDDILCEQCEQVIATAPMPTDEDYDYLEKKAKVVRDALSLLVGKHTAHEEKERIERILSKLMTETIALTGGSKSPWTQRAE